VKKRGVGNYYNLLFITCACYVAGGGGGVCFLCCGGSCWWLQNVGRRNSSTGLVTRVWRVN